MVKISILNNKTCKIEGIDQALFGKLRRLLSFRANGVEYTSAYQNNNWDGITYLLNKKGDFPLGLLPNVKNYLSSNNHPFIIEDRRIPPISRDEILLTQKLISLGKIPRKYQLDIVDAAVNNEKGIIRAATGSGKTLVANLLVAKFNIASNIYVIGLDLLQQFHDLFSQVFEEPIGFIGDGRCETYRINIVSVWTAGRALGLKSKITEEELDVEEKETNSNTYPQIIQCLQKARLHIFDECHAATSDTIRSIYGVIDPQRIYGLSGTPYRDDGRDLLINSMLGEQIIDVPASDLIKDGYLVQPIFKFVKVPKLHISSQAAYPTIYKEYITENKERNLLIIRCAQDLLTKNYQVLVLFKHLQHGENLRELFDEENIQYEYLSGKDPLEDRMKVKERLLARQSNLVITSSIFDQGVDIASISGLILAGSGKSNTRTLQRVGRCLRPFMNKQFAAIVDFYDDVKYLKNHSKIRHKIYQSEQGFKILTNKAIKW